MPAAKSSRVAAGCGSTSQRVAAAPGSAAAAWRRRSPMTPPSRARSASRRLAVRSRARGWPRISPSTAASPAQRSPSSKTHSVSSGRRVTTMISRAGARPKRSRPGPWGWPPSRAASSSPTSSGRSSPARRARMAAAKPVAAEPARVSPPAPHGGRCGAGRRRAGSRGPRSRRGAASRPGGARGAAWTVQGRPPSRPAAEWGENATRIPRGRPAFDFGDPPAEPGYSLPPP